MDKAPKKPTELKDSVRLEKAVKILYEFMLAEGLLDIEGWEPRKIRKKIESLESKPSIKIKTTGRQVGEYYESPS